MTVEKKMKFTFWTLFVAVLTVFTLKGVFLMSRYYGITANGRRCEQNATDNQTITVVSPVDHEYIFTTVVYGVANVLRCVEYLLLGQQFYYFLFKQKVINVADFYTKHSKRYWYLLVVSIILLPYLLLGLIIPSLGIYQELELTSRLEKCYRHHHELFITYCAINIFRYLSAYSVRFMMIFTTLAISKYWFPEHSGPPGHTSIARSFMRKKEEDDSSTQNESPSDISAHTQIHSVSSNAEEESPVQTEKVLQDWKAVSSDFQDHYKAYSNIGKQIRVINELFQTWFIIPWVVYLIASSLKTYNILRPWANDSDGDTPPSNIPRIYYLLYNLNQFVTLLIPYLCAKKINTYHHKYYKRMRNWQLVRFKDEPSRLSFANQLLVEKEERYDFLPRILGTSITISIGSPLYVIILLAGIFLSVAESLL